MVTVRAKFDGSVFVPEQSVPLRANERVTLHVEQGDEPGSVTLAKKREDLLAEAGRLQRTPPASGETADPIVEKFRRQGLKL